MVSRRRRAPPSPPDARTLQQMAITTCDLLPCTRPQCPFNHDDRIAEMCPHDILAADTGRWQYCLDPRCKYVRHVPTRPSFHHHMNTGRDCKHGDGCTAITCIFRHPTLTPCRLPCNY